MTPRPAGMQQLTSVLNPQLPCSGWVHPDCPLGRIPGQKLTPKRNSNMVCGSVCLPEMNMHQQFFITINPYSCVAQYSNRNMADWSAWVTDWYLLMSGPSLSMVVRHKASLLCLWPERDLSSAHLSPHLVTDVTCLQPVQTLLTTILLQLQGKMLTCIPYSPWAVRSLYCFQNRFSLHHRTVILCLAVQRTSFLWQDLMMFLVDYDYES